MLKNTLIRTTFVIASLLLVGGSSFALKITSDASNTKEIQFNIFSWDDKKDKFFTEQYSVNLESGKSRTINVMNLIDIFEDEKQQSIAGYAHEIGGEGIAAHAKCFVVNIKNKLNVDKLNEEHYVISYAENRLHCNEKM